MAAREAGRTGRLATSTALLVAGRVALGVTRRTSTMRGPTGRAPEAPPDDLAGRHGAGGGDDRSAPPPPRSHERGVTRTATTERRRIVIGIAAVLGLGGLAVLLRARHRVIEVPWGWLIVGLVASGVVLGVASVWWSPVDDSRVSRFYELAGDAAVALLAGAIVGLVIFAATEDLEHRLRVAETRRDNIRFVREIATQPDGTAKPFAGLDLRDAPLSSLDLPGADFIGANLSGADLNTANLSGANLTRADLGDANLARVDLTLADLRDADLSDATLTRAHAGNAWLTLVDLTDADLRAAELTDAQLTRVQLEDADLTSADLRGARMTGADLTGANLTNANLTGANLTAADLSGADLTGVDLVGVNLCRTVDDEETTWPQGFEHERTCPR